MAPHVIVSYDDSPNDRDALALGRVLRDAGASLTLAYVRHATMERAEREQLEISETEALLERGATWLEDSYIERRVVMSPSTGEGLVQLAAATHAEVVLLGCAYRTAAGHVSIGTTTAAVLESGATAVAIAPAGYASATTHDLNTIGILPGTADEAAIETAHSLATRYEAAVVQRGYGVDLLVVGSRPEAREGRTLITSAARNAIEEATAPVLVVGRGVPLSFETLVTA